MATASEVNTLMDAASAAMASQDYNTALIKCAQAEALLAAIPDSSSEATSLRYDRQAPGRMRATINSLRRATSTTGGIGQTPMKWRGPGRSGT